MAGTVRIFDINRQKSDDTITKILYLIYFVWHLATPFLVSFSFLDSTISGHVIIIIIFIGSNLVVVVFISKQDKKYISYVTIFE